MVRKLRGDYVNVRMHTHVLEEYSRNRKHWLLPRGMEPVQDGNSLFTSFPFVSLNALPRAHVICPV